MAMLEGCTESTVLGPFFVEGAPELPLGASIAKPGTPGEPCVVTGSVRDPKGRPIAGALLDVWEGDGEGFYDVQRPDGMNLRGRFRTGPDGEFWLKCVRPTSYPVPTDGPAGRLLKAAGRHPMRPGIFTPCSPRRTSTRSSPISSCAAIPISIRTRCSA